MPFPAAIYGDWESILLRSSGRLNKSAWETFPNDVSWGNSMSVQGGSQEQAPRPKERLALPEEDSSARVTASSTQWDFSKEHIGIVLGSLGM